MRKIYDLLAVLESSTVTSPHFVQARTMIQAELGVIAESIEEPALRDTVLNARQLWSKLGSTGTLESYFTAVKDLKMALKKLP